MKKTIRVAVALCLAMLAVQVRAADLEKGFAAPPDSAKPWVYWFFMDGNMTREGMTADLEAMKSAGIGGAIILEVNRGIPRGTVDFMSAPWLELIKHAIHEADRLGLEIALGAGPGWCGTGGPWVKPEQSMQHLVASETNVVGPMRFDGVLPQPQPRSPFFGEKALAPELRKMWKEFYQDVVVLAFPTPVGGYRIPDVNEKALYFRAPYTSSLKDNVRPFLSADRTVLPSDQCIGTNTIVELQLKDGRLDWDVPPGNWTIMRFGRTITGQTTRPAPAPGLGLESDKFDKAALDAHFESFIGTLLKTVGEPEHPGRGLTTLHFDSWEMSSQNWSEKFRDEFRQRRGYDPLRYLPVMLGQVVESVAVSERFLWDLRRTAQELVVENHAQHLKELGRQHGLSLSIEPYDLNPAGDLALGGAADVPMCEFWSSKGNVIVGAYSCFEAVSIAHTMGRPVVGAEAFTARRDAWRQYPGSMKDQGDWALCAGINRFVIHRYQHQPWLDRFPGMTFGPIGIHWERTQTWWPMVSAYHTYLARCQALLRYGLPVADILYLDVEGAPSVFRPPVSATLSGFPDRRGYTFDGCASGALIERAAVKDGRITFPDGMSYRLLVLPQLETMTPALLRKIKELVNAGAAVVGMPPKQSPGLENYPECDAEVQKLAAEIWQNKNVICDASPAVKMSEKPPFPDVYPGYDTTAKILVQMGVPPDFESDGDLRYTHRYDKDAEIYFVGNRTAVPVSAECRFRVTGRQLELWDPVTGEQRALPEFREQDGRTIVQLRFAPRQSYFVLFRNGQHQTGTNFPELKPVSELTGPWEVAFDPKWGGPESVTFEKLEDWSKRAEESIRYYSGTAVYRKTFQSTINNPQSKIFLDLGRVAVMARVKLNGRDCGVVWTEPHRVDITSAVKPGENTLEISVANLWPNRLIGDEQLPKDCDRTVEGVFKSWPQWLVDGKPSPTGRFTVTTYQPWKKDDALLPSGLHGPVTIQTTDKK
jgi:hypothetical protein